MVLCVYIVVGALAAQPAADDLSGPSTVLRCFWGGFVGVKDNGLFRCTGRRTRRARSRCTRDREQHHRGIDMSSRTGSSKLQTLSLFRLVDRAVADKRKILQP